MIRRMARRGVVATRAALVVLSLVAPPPASAQQVLVIGDDRGGYVGQRARTVERIRAAGQRVEIRGSVCFSACTMYLGAGDVCVSARTRFGFHGPSDHGRPLSPERFESYSELMAGFYNRPLRIWFMSEARHHIRSLRYVTGAELIRLGYPACT